MWTKYRNLGPSRSSNGRKFAEKSVSGGLQRTPGKKTTVYEGESEIIVNLKSLTLKYIRIGYAKMICNQYGYQKVNSHVLFAFVDTCLLFNG